MTWFARLRSFAPGLALLMFVAAFSGCSPAPIDCRSPKITCVGLVTDVNGLDDAGLNEQAWQVLESLRADGVVVNLIESMDGRDYAKNLAYFAGHGYDFVIASGYDVSEIALPLAADYPETSFLMLGRVPDEKNSLPNLAGVIFPEQKAGFWAGVIAARFSETGIVGAVFAHPALPPVIAYSIGFETGAQEAQVRMVFRESFRFADTLIDPKWGAQQALSLEQDGVDVLFAYGGATALAALEQARGQIIGVETDLARRYPHFRARVIASIVFDLSILKKIINAGQFSKPIYEADYRIVWGETPALESLPKFTPVSLPTLNAEGLIDEESFPSDDATQSVPEAPAVGDEEDDNEEDNTDEDEGDDEEEEEE